MVANESKKLSSYELFQKLLSINTEYQQLKDRMKVLGDLRRDIEVQLTNKCHDNEIAAVGVVEIEGHLYYYDIELEDAEVKGFHPVSQVNQRS